MDQKLRELEREAASGDHSAQERLSRLKERATMTLTLDELKAKKDAFDKQIADEGREIIHATFQSLFKKHPKLCSISWTQYTPYWQDGEVCEFGYYSFLWDENDNIVFLEDASSEEKTLAMNDLKVLDAKLQKMENILELVFGDHTKVTATPYSLEQEEYEHE